MKIENFVTFRQRVDDYGPKFLCNFWHNYVFEHRRRVVRGEAVEEKHEGERARDIPNDFFSLYFKCDTGGDVDAELDERGGTNIEIKARDYIRHTLRVKLNGARHMLLRQRNG